jgi:anti-sigma-K factor RskA
MTHEELRGLIPAYAISALDEDERLALEAHLRDCADCRALLADHRRLGDDLLYATPYMTAPAGLAEDLRRRITPGARPQSEPPARFSWGALLRRPAFGLALAGLALLLLVGTNLYWAARVTRVEREAAAVTALAQAPAIRLSGDEGAGRGVLFRPEDGDISLLCVWGMQPLPEDQTYQVWLISGEERVSGGTFRVTDDGYGVMFVRPPDSPRAYDGLGITVEPAGGSPGPTSPRLLGAEL